MSAMPISADDATAAAPVSQASSVQVVTNPDPASQPGQATDWSDPAKYQGYVPVQILGLMTFMVGFPIPVPLRSAIRPIKIRGRQKDWLAL